MATFTRVVFVLSVGLLIGSVGLNVYFYTTAASTNRAIERLNYAYTSRLSGNSPLNYLEVGKTEAYIGALISEARNLKNENARLSGTLIQVRTALDRAQRSGTGGDVLRGLFSLLTGIPLPP